MGMSSCAVCMYLQVTSMWGDVFMLGKQGIIKVNLPSLKGLGKHAVLAETCKFAIVHMDVLWY